MNREPIYAALFARLQAAYPWATASRVLQHWSDVSPIQQPALFQAQVNEVAQTITRQHTKWTMHVRLYVYANSQTPGGKLPSTTLNAILDAVTTALKPDYAGQETLTLGGLVEWARIDGMIETDEGVLGDQTVAIIPVTLYTAD
jgi:hypothetical protein